MSRTSIGSILLRREVVLFLIALLMISSILTAVLREQPGSLAAQSNERVRTYNNYLLTGTAAVSSLSLVLAIVLMAEKLRKPSGRMRNAAARWAMITFHCGLLLIVLSFLYRGAFGQRGYIQLIEGDTVTMRSYHWLSSEKGIFAGEFDPGFTFGLLRVLPEYWENDELRDVTGRLVLEGVSGRQDHFVSLQGPVEENGTSIYQSDDYGYVTSFLLTQHNASLTTNYLLNAPSARHLPFTGGGEFPAAGYDVRISLYPDMHSPSFYASAPAAYVTVTGGRGVLYDGIIRFGQEIPIGEDALTFADLRYWSGFIFTKRQGTAVFYAGIFLSILGCCMYYLLPSGLTKASPASAGRTTEISDAPRCKAGLEV